MISCRHDDSWLAQTVEALAYGGYEVVTDVFDAGEHAGIRDTMFSARDSIHADVGEEKLEHAGEFGVLRLMVKYEPSLLGLLEKPELLAGHSSSSAGTHGL